MASLQTIDLRSEQFRKSPHAEFARVREAGPFCRIEPFGYLGVTRYDEVCAVLKNPKVFSSQRVDVGMPVLAGAEFFTRSSTLINQDPPDHSRVRRFLQKSFTLHEMALWQPRIETMTRQLLKRATAQTSFDLIGDIAMPLPVAVISHMLGIDTAMSTDFKRWSDDLLSVRAAQFSTDPEWRAQREREIVRSSGEFMSYFTEIIAERKTQPRGPDLISAMVHSGEDGAGIRADEVLSLVRLMLVAGNETTTNLLGNAVKALLDHPDQWSLLTASPQLANQAIEETLRFDGPVLQLLRRVEEPTELAGLSLPRDTMLAPLLASANRDPRRFADADRFDILQPAQTHIAFGFGIHLCIGAPLARMEAQIALRLLAEHCPHVELADEPPALLDALTIRGHKRLILRHSQPGWSDEVHKSPRSASI